MGYEMNCLKNMPKVEKVFMGRKVEARESIKGGICSDRRANGV